VIIAQQIEAPEERTLRDPTHNRIAYLFHDSFRESLDRDYPEGPSMKGSDMGVQWAGHSEQVVCVGKHLVRLYKMLFTVLPICGVYSLLEHRPQPARYSKLVKG
jgi:hypothetical protein